MPIPTFPRMLPIFDNYLISKVELLSTLKALQTITILSYYKILIAFGYKSAYSDMDSPKKPSYIIRLNYTEVKTH